MRESEAEAHFSFHPHAEATGIKSKETQTG